MIALGPAPKTRLTLGATTRSDSAASRDRKDEACATSPGSSFSEGTQATRPISVPLARPRAASRNANPPKATSRSMPFTVAGIGVADPAELSSASATGDASSACTSVKMEPTVAAASSPTGVMAPTASMARALTCAPSGLAARGTCGPSRSRNASLGSGHR